MALWQRPVCGVKYMSEFLESKVCKITCIAPVHIGSGQQLKAFEYLYDQKNSQVYFINEGMWAQLLGKYQLLDEFIDILNAPGNASKANLWQWLQEKNIPMEEIDECIVRKAELVTEISDAKGTLNDIHTAVTTGTKGLYIPGSTIKGMLRTAIIYHLLNKDAVAKEFAARKVQEAIDEGKLKKESKKIISQIEARLLERKMEEHKLQKLMAGLHVGDAHISNSILPIILQRTDISTHGGKLKNNEKHLPLYWECIPAGTELTCQISLDKTLMKEIGITSIIQLLSYCEEYMQDGLIRQQHAFPAKYKPLFDEAETGNCFLGGGTGFLQKSIWFSLFNDDNLAKNELKNFMDFNFRQHCHRSLDRIISPRTLKVAKTGRDMYLMGLCNIEVQK